MHSIKVQSNSPSRNNKTQEIDLSETNPNAFLTPPLHQLVTIRLNSDVTSIYDELFSTDDFKA